MFTILLYRQRKFQISMSAHKSSPHPGGGQGYVAMLIPFLLYIVHSYQINSYSFAKVNFPAGISGTDASCTSSFSIASTQPLRIARTCLLTCTQTPLCSSFTLNGQICTLLSYTQLPPHPNDTGVQYYSGFDTDGFSIDLARNKPASGTVGSFSFLTWTWNFAPVSSVVTGAKCATGDPDCWCSDVTYKQILIDLGLNYTIKLITILSHPTQLGNIGVGLSTIYVGSQGNDLDPVFARVREQPAARVPMKFHGNAFGRYIFMQKTSTGWFDLSGLCLCFLGAYGY